MKYDDPRWYDQSGNNQPQADAPDTSTQQAEDVSTVETTETQTTASTTQKSPRQRIFGQVIITLAFMAISFLGGWFAHQAYTNSFFTADSQSQQYAESVPTSLDYCRSELCRP